MSLLDPSMDDLPVEVMVDILSRLPIKTIVQCKCVCKKWRNIVLDSYFANLQLSRSPTGYMICHDSKLDYHNYEEDEVYHHYLRLDPVMSLDLKLAPIFQNSKILPVGSVNGLVCLWQFGHGKDNTFICNLITREYMILPRQQYHNGSDAMTVYSFGFGSLTHEYKVIRIFQRRIRPINHILKEAEVYTLGTGRWRSLGHVPYRLGYFNGLFFNGHAHWIVRDKDSPECICAFDFDNETFELFLSPPFEATNQSSIFTSLGVLKGCLCRCENYNANLTVWVMKEYGIIKSWRKELVIKEGISRSLDLLISEPVYIIEGYEDGTILMGSYGETQALYVYCPQRNIVVDMQIFNYDFKGFAYRPSFHRLAELKNERVDVF